MHRQYTAVLCRNAVVILPANRNLIRFDTNLKFKSDFSIYRCDVTKHAITAHLIVLKYRALIKVTCQKRVTPGFWVKFPEAGEVGLCFRHHRSAPNNRFSLIYISDSDSDIPIFSLCVIILLRAHRNPQEDSYTSAGFENWRFCIRDRLWRAFSSSSYPDLRHSLIPFLSTYS